MIYIKTIFGMMALMGTMGLSYSYAAQDLFSYTIRSPLSEIGTEMSKTYTEFKKEFATKFGSLKGNQQASLLLAEEVLRSADLNSDKNEKEELLQLFNGMLEIARLCPIDGRARDLYEAFFGLATSGEKLSDETRTVALVAASQGPGKSLLQAKTALSPLLNRSDRRLKFVFNPSGLLKLIRSSSNLGAASSFYGAKKRGEIEGIARLSKHSEKSPLDVAYWLKNGRGKEGSLFEEYLIEEAGSWNFFSETETNTYQFSGATGNIWFDVRSDDFWSDNYGGLGFDQFMAETLERRLLAQENEKEYEIITNCLIPEEARKWMDSKSIHYFEIL